MTTTFKVLGQVTPAAATLTPLYTAPAQAIVSSIVVCNQDAGPATFRIAVAVAGAATAAKQYLAYEAPIVGHDTISMTLGVTLAVGDVLRVYANTATVSFNAFGEEVS